MCVCVSVCLCVWVFCFVVFTLLFFLSFFFLVIQYSFYKLLRGLGSGSFLTKQNKTTTTTTTTKNTSSDTATRSAYRVLLCTPRAKLMGCFTCPTASSSGFLSSNPTTSSTYEPLQFRSGSKTGMWPQPEPRPRVFIVTQYTCLRGTPPTSISQQSV